MTSYASLYFNVILVALVLLLLGILKAFKGKILNLV